MKSTQQAMRVEGIPGWNLPSQIEIAATQRQPEQTLWQSRILADVAHDLRTPLSVIASSAGLLSSMRLDAAKTQKHCQRIQRNVEQMVQMIEDLLLVSRAESTEFAIAPTWVDLPSVCAEWVEEAQQLSDRHQVIFTAPACTQIVQVDLALVQRIVVNLLSNSIKYSPDGGRVDVRLEYRANTVVLQIQDDGIGIPLSDQSHLFDSFYRAKNTGAISGTGLGLAIVKRCVDLHGGAIALESQVGIGTTFTVTLPVSLRK